MAIGVALAYLEVVTPPPGKSRFEAISGTLVVVHVAALCGVLAGVLLVIRAAVTRRRALGGIGAAAIASGLGAGAFALLPFLFYVSEGCASPSTSTRLLRPLPDGVSVVREAAWHGGRELIVDEEGSDVAATADALVDEYSSRGWRLQRPGDEPRWVAKHAGVWGLEVEQRGQTVAVRHEVLWDNNCQ